MQYPPTELVLNSNNQVYHLGLSREQIADTVILVGDQDRVELVSSFFNTIEHRSQHREFVCHTGTYKGKRISALSTGIGTDNIDITINELDALVNIDLENREDLPTKKSLNLIRIGTCGILHADVPVHSFILSSHAMGLDNIAHFYKTEESAEEAKVLESLLEQIDFPKQVEPYLRKASDSLVSLLQSDKTHIGITITSSGFYGPQGRQLRIPTHTTQLNEQLSAYSDDTLKIMNFEMESSALFALGHAMGHNCATICLGIANRPNKEFSKGYNDKMLELIEYVLERV